MPITRFGFAIFILILSLAARTASAVPLPPGSIDTSFGDNGFVRLYYDQRLGTTTDDAGHTIMVVRGDIGGGAFGPKWILLAGIAGSYVQITRLTMNGQIDPTFGANGVAFSARTNVSSYGGMVTMPNGDIVIGYADDYLGPDADARDFFIEVFTADGQPKNVGGDESPNQRWVDLSSNNTNVGDNPCDFYYRENRAQRLILTAEGGIVLVGDIAVYDNDGAFYKREAAMAEFNGGTYAPARPGTPCTSAGGRLDTLRRPGISSMGYIADGDVHSAVSDVGAHVLFVGSSDPRDDTEVAQFGIQNFRDLANGYVYNDAYDIGVPAGYWQQRQSDFWQIRKEVQPGSFVLFGDAENGTFSGNVRRLPIIATSSANTMSPLWFFPVGAAADTAITALDGQRLPGALDLMVIGGARNCSAAGCTGDWNSLAVGISNGHAVLNAYQPQGAFGNQGWVRYAVPDYDGTPSSHALAWSGVIQSGVSLTADTNLFVVGEFRTNVDGHLDTFVTKLRVLNGGDPPWYVPGDTIFRDGFD